jgi:hypothetical protein
MNHPKIHPFVIQSHFLSAIIRLRKEVFVLENRINRIKIVFYSIFMIMMTIAAVYFYGSFSNAGI